MLRVYTISSVAQHFQWMESQKKIEGDQVVSYFGQPVGAMAIELHNQPYGQLLPRNSSRKRQYRTFIAYDLLYDISAAHCVSRRERWYAGIGEKCIRSFDQTRGWLIGKYILIFHL